MTGFDGFSHPLNDKPILTGPVFYWMNRDQRVMNNRALLKAQQIALSTDQPLCVVFCMSRTFPAASERQIAFMSAGLKTLETSLDKLNIPFLLLNHQSIERLNELFKVIKPGAVFTDFSPLTQWVNWRSQVSEKLNCMCLEVDSHNIVPCREVTGKQEFGAYTIRPKINKVLNDYLHPLPDMMRHPVSFGELDLDKLKPYQDEFVQSSLSSSGEKAAETQLEQFLEYGIHRYDRRNDPNQDAASGLSPYIHFGQISALQIALEVQQGMRSDEISEKNGSDFLEQLVIRRELSDNFCFYNPHYEEFSGFPEWARKTLDLHRSDRRTWLYSVDHLEGCKTHDALWNAAQQEMMTTGNMHGYMRMYWAKKILEWSESPDQALKSAITLNDRYSLDGMDPNGYVGIAWSIGGVHDRAWGERPVFGKIRYMSFDGCKRKFDIDVYIQKNKQKG